MSEFGHDDERLFDFLQKEEENLKRGLLRGVPNKYWAYHRKQGDVTKQFCINNNDNV